MAMSVVVAPDHEPSTSVRICIMFLDRSLFVLCSFMAPYGFKET